MSTTTLKAQALPEEDTLYTAQLKEAMVRGDRIWENDTLRYRYNQTKYYVKLIMPLLNASTKMFNDINGYLKNEQLSKKQRKQYLAQQEEQMRIHFEDKIKALNTTQGALLIKLIARQTHLNLYQIINEFKGSFAAIKWQTWAKAHGFNLNRYYNPEEEPDLERIMHQLGYPLPDSYFTQ